MKYYYKYEGHEPKTLGKRKKFDNNIYTFDIETTSFIEFRGKFYPAIYYDNLDEDEKKEVKYYSTMYLWQFGINEAVYYGRTWEELKSFLLVLDTFIPERKYVFIHNLAFEFQYLKGEYHFDSVFARKSRKVMYAIMKDYNIIFKCSYFMSNASLKQLPKLFKLPVEKMVGDLDYNLLRHSKTPLSEKELRYGEYDCLVVYYYILEELKTYGDVSKIPSTSTGHVRRELMDLVMKDYNYRRLVYKSINTDPIVFNKLQDSFAGGITHASWLYSDKILENIDSYDETSAYPYVLCVMKYPSSEFRRVNVTRKEQMNKRFAYILDVEFRNVESRYYNNYISSSKCRDIVGAKYDNGRIISAKSFSMTITDIDFYLILDCYDLEYEIKECYFATKSYLPIKEINFILDKYVKKTEYKDNPEYELEYAKEKNKFNAIFGMSVTNEIRSNVIYDDITKLWEEVELTNDEIIEKLLKQKKKSFMSYSTGIFVTSYARDNLFRRVMELDDYVVYMDTDSIKLVEGYPKKVFDEYNKEVEKRIEYTSRVLGIPKEKFAPCDIHGKSHMLGLFEYETNGLNDHTYKKFVTQGAKKYCYVRDEKDKKTGEIIKDKISITVAGVPKAGYKCLKSIEDFKDNLYFPYSVTGKQSVVYIDEQEEVELTDYLGIKNKITDKSGCCIIPCSYTLNKSDEYRSLLIDNSSKRARFKV